MIGIEFRIQAKDRNGKSVQRFVTVQSGSVAREKAKSLATSLGWTILSIKKKKKFYYRVRRGTSFFDGYQYAYSREEVVNALKGLNFEVKVVRRQFDFQAAAPTSELVSFIGSSARLLEQKLPYNEILLIMSNNVRNKHLRNALREIVKDLKDGADSQEAFVRQSKVFGPDTALMLGIASKSGNMQAIFESVGHFVERQAEFKKALTSSLILPAVTSLALVGALAFYVFYLLPEMVKLLGPMVTTLPPLTAMTLGFSGWVQDHILLILLFMVLATGGLYAYLATPKGRIAFDRLIIRVPYIGRILQNTSVEMFCRVLGIMYTSSGENIDAIQRACESSRNHHFEQQIKTVAIPSMLKYGTEFAKALELTGFLPEMALSRFRTAGETGDVKGTAVQLADYYEMENGFAMKNLLSAIEVSISMLIMLAMVFLTYLSSETANIKIEGIH